MKKYDLFVDNKLPQPLKKEEIYKLFQEANNGSKEAKDKLIIHNIRLVLHQVHTKFISVEYDKDELVSLGIMGLIKAVDTYDLSKNSSFSTYAIACINNEILMFLRKLKKDNKLDSLDSAVFKNSFNESIKLEDTLFDDKNIVEDFEKKEMSIIIRKLVQELPDKEKEIIMLYFGFYNDRTYTQKEISKIFKLSQSYISRIITITVNRLKEQLENTKVQELYEQKEETKEKNKNMRRLQTIYEYFKDYTKEEINEMLLKLTEEEKTLLTLRYGENLDKPVQTKLDRKTTNKFYVMLLPKMKKLLSNSTDKKSKKQSNSVNPKLVNEDILELLKTPFFKELLKELNIKEIVIISLKYGYINGKCYSTQSIATLLKTEEKEVIEIIKKVLILYKERINNLLDDMINLKKVL